MNDTPLHGFEPPPPPPGLREAALRAARERLTEDLLPDVWTRVIRSRATRLAWAASVVLLTAAHLALPRSRQEGPHSVTVTAPLLEPEVRAIAKLPRIDEQSYAACSGERS
jgi:hypothetical protein